MRPLCSIFFYAFAVVTASAPVVAYAQEQATRRSAGEAGLSAQALRRAMAPHVEGLTIDERRARAHVIRPQHIVGVFSDLGRHQGKLQFTPSTPITYGPKEPHLDVNAFALHRALKDQVAGYVMRLRKNGQTIYTLEWNWAKTPQDGGVGWTPQRQMHVASVSKLITAIAVTRLLNEKNISYDAKMIEGPRAPISTR